MADGLQGMEPAQGPSRTTKHRSLPPSLTYGFFLFLNCLHRGSFCDPFSV